MAADKFEKFEAKSGRIGGLVYRGKNRKGPTLVVFNQWRSGATSIFSKFLSGMVLAEPGYCGVLFIDRVASGGMSDNVLTKAEKPRMRDDGEMLFGGDYAAAIRDICDKHDLSPDYVIAGSSAGAPAVLATVISMPASQLKRVKACVLVEPGGIRSHGVGKKGRGSVAHAFARHAFAYRHRLQRGWWTPMDKEQYFAKKGKMFEHRAHWWAGDGLLQELIRVTADSQFPPVRLVLSTTSHVHTAAVRKQLKASVVPPHQVLEIVGNHDKICQPPSLSKFYLDVLS